MGLRIATNIPSLVAQRNLQESGAETAKSLARLSSGNRIVHAGDDAAGLGISTSLQAEVRGLQQAQRNTSDGISFAQTAEGALNEVSNILVRLRELGVQAASDTIGDQERGFINKEYETMKSEIQRIANVTSFNGRSLLNGTGGDLSFQVGSHSGEDNVVHYASSESDATLHALGISSTSVSSKGDASDSLENIDGAINKVNFYRADLGALQNRLHSASNNLSTHIDNISEAHSRIADTDIASETANLAKNQIMQSAGIAVLAQANASPNVVMKLL